MSLNGFDEYFNNVPDQNIQELNGFFKSIKKAASKAWSGVKSVVKDVGRAGEKVLKEVKRIDPAVAAGILMPTVVGGTAAYKKASDAGLLPPPQAMASMFVPGIGGALGPMLGQTAMGTVGATAANILKNSPLTSQVMGQLGSIIPQGAVDALQGVKGSVTEMFNAVVPQEVQDHFNKAITSMKMGGKTETQILGEMLQSDIFKGVASKINESVVGKLIMDQMIKMGVPPEVAAAEAKRKAPVIAVAASEEVAQKAPGSFDMAKLLPFAPLLFIPALMKKR